LLRVDATKVAATRLDGKYLLRTSDPHLSAEDIALGYKQLLEVERGWRDMNQVLDLRPVYHRLEDRTRAHVLLCWLAPLQARIVEIQADTTWTPPAPNYSACTLAPSPAPPACSARAPPTRARDPPASRRPRHHAPAADPAPGHRSPRNAAPFCGLSPDNSCGTPGRAHQPSMRVVAHAAIMGSA